MKTLLMAAVALTALTATPALASVPTQTYTFQGTVASICTIAGASQVSFGALTGATGAYQNPGAKDATDTNAYCNQSQTQATISHTNLVNAVAPASGFTNIVPMTASLTTDQGSLADASTATGATASAGTTGSIGAFSSLKVTATLGTPSTTLESGTYDGSITVTLNPAP